MSHSLIVISPVSRLVTNDAGQIVEPLGALIAGDGVLPTPLVAAGTTTPVTHYGCHAGGTSAAAVARIEAVYAGQMPADALPEGLALQDVADALSEIVVSIDGRIMGVDAEYPEERLTGRAHFEAAIARVGLEREPADELI
jgi:hypothetical protein